MRVKGYTDTEREKSLKFVHNLLQRKLTKVPELRMGEAAQQQKRHNWGQAIRGQHLGG